MFQNDGEKRDYMVTRIGQVRHALQSASITLSDLMATLEAEGDTLEGSTYTEGSLLDFLRNVKEHVLTEDNRLHDQTLIAIYGYSTKKPEEG